ncbi:hypothetical protein ACQYAD_03435 [Neobacillus sp. SM06]|uniref:hypothetical protein n=1 Tax=Neobacillus sp. SM06 TaxID=3422492 RepID=UPI003D29A6F0
MRKPFKLVFLALILMLALGACSSPSVKKESAEAVKEARTILAEQPRKPNQNSGGMEFYLPFGFKIVSKSPNNLILKKGSKTYILFVNPKEKALSDVMYKASGAQYKKLAANEKFTSQNKLGYVLIAPIKDDLNELTVGIGGSKLTTETNNANLKEEARTMMRIIHSLKVTGQK